MLEERIGQKFGSSVLETVLSVTQRRVDDDGNELDKDEKKADYLDRLAQADARAHWVCSADKVHNGCSILADLRRTVDADTVWSRFSVGREGTIQWYRAVHDRLVSLGFDAPIVAELRAVAESLERYR
jgi:(p)ppGpp synthase/HD superfamily hydrolase